MMIALLFSLIVLGIIFEIVSLKRNPDKVKYDCAISASVTEPGVPFKVQSIITNTSRLPVAYLGVREVFPSHAKLPEDMEFNERIDGLHVLNTCQMRGRQRKKLSLEVSIDKRGVHSFRGTGLIFGDFLGFREFPHSVYNREEIVVYPEKRTDHGLADALGKFCGDVATRRFFIRDPILTVGVREYTGREPMKEIHWLHSAHSGDLMVREFDYNRQLSACVIMSVEGIGFGGLTMLDEICVLARSVCETLTDAGVLVSFFTNAKLKNIISEDSWRCEVSSSCKEDFLEGLGRVVGYETASLSRTIDRAYRESDPDTAFVIILPKGDCHGEDTADRLKRRTSQEVLILKSA